jgi:hypothetical protein
MLTTLEVSTHAHDHHSSKEVSAVWESRGIRESTDLGVEFY